MNKKQTEAFCQESASLLDMRMRQNAKRNKCGFPGGRAHASKVYEICYILNELGKTFYTEAIFKNGMRADIFILSDRIAVEVLDSESESSLNKKRSSYPCRIVAVRTGEGFCWEEMLC